MSIVEIMRNSLIDGITVELLPICYDKAAEPGICIFVRKGPKYKTPYVKKFIPFNEINELDLPHDNAIAIFAHAAVEEFKAQYRKESSK